MKVVEIQFNRQTFLVPAESLIPVMLYHKYGNYYLDIDGWELKPNKEKMHKERFHFNIQKDDVLQLEVKVIDTYLASSLMENNVKSTESVELTDLDFNEMLCQFRALEKLLKEEGLLQ